jgi:hypothetical protein
MKTGKHVLPLVIKQVNSLSKIAANPLHRENKTKQGSEGCTP